MVPPRRGRCPHRPARFCVQGSPPTAAGVGRHAHMPPKPGALWWRPRWLRGPCGGVWAPRPTVYAFDGGTSDTAARADMRAPTMARSVMVLMMSVPSGPMWASAPTECVRRRCVRGRIYNPPLRPRSRPSRGGGPGEWPEGQEKPAWAVAFYTPQAAQNGRVATCSTPIVCYRAGENSSRAKEEGSLASRKRTTYSSSRARVMAT